MILLALEPDSTNTTDPLGTPFGILAKILPIVGYSIATVGLLLVFANAARMAMARNSYDRSDAVNGVIGGIAAVILGSGLSMVSGVFGESGAADGAEAEPAPPVHEQLPAAGADQAGEDGGFNAMIVLVVGGGIGALILIALVASAVRGRIRDRKEERDARARDWAAAQAVYKGVLDDYAAYLTDPFAWLLRPILEDVDEPLTGAFLEALGVAQSLDLDVVPTDQGRIDRFREAAQNVRAAWDKADANARSIGTSIYEERSRNKLRKAAFALRTALDDSATTEERAAAVATVNRLTDGLVKAPQRILGTVTAAIETARRKELPVGLDQ